LHDPTTLNRQGNDVGTQYRSVIFYHSPEQHLIAQNVIVRVEREKHWPKPIVSQLVPFKKWWRAEEYHQRYLEKDPRGYTCHFMRKW
jgi:methionine-S-sulfoxide reductase